MKILDFGLARDAADEIRLTHTGAVLGTPAYMSPEQAAGIKVDSRTDLFSLGVVLYEMVTGRLPFAGANPIAVLHAITYEPHPPLASLKPQVPAGLVTLIDRMLAKRPEDRPATAAEVAAELAKIEGTARDAAETPAAPFHVPAKTSVVDTEVTPVERPSPLRLPPRRRRSLFSWAAPLYLAVVALNVVVYFAYFKRDPADDQPNLPQANTDSTSPPVEQERIIKVEPPKKELPPPPAHDEVAYDLGNGVKLDMVRIKSKGKSFVIGPPATEEARNPFDKELDPEQQRELRFGHDYGIGKHEVTQEQYEAVMGRGANLSEFKGAKNPVDSVSWDEAKEFCEKLNDKFRDRGVQFRLPSEAEWE